VCHEIFDHHWNPCCLPRAHWKHCDGGHDSNPPTREDRTRFARSPGWARCCARKAQPRSQLNVDIAQFVQGMLGGGPVPYANLMRDVASMPASHGSSGYSPSYDYSSGPPASCAACDSQAAADQENQEIQQMDDINAMNASNAAAAAQNAADTAATIQTEINAGI